MASPLNSCGGSAAKKLPRKQQSRQLCRLFQDQILCPLNGDVSKERLLSTWTLNGLSYLSVTGSTLKDCARWINDRVFRVSEQELLYNQIKTTKYQ